MSHCALFFVFSLPVFSYSIYYTHKRSRAAQRHYESVSLSCRLATVSMGYANVPTSCTSPSQQHPHAPSPDKHQTSSIQLNQSPHPYPMHLFFRGPANRREIALAQHMFGRSHEDIKNTHSVIIRAYDSLWTTMSLVENKRAISETESVKKLTKLTFLFIPVSFAASFFSMPLDVRSALLETSQVARFSGNYVKFP